MVTARKLVTRARVEGLVIAVVALGYLRETRSIPALYQMPGVPGPAAFPSVLGVALCLAGLWRLLAGAAAGEADPGEDRGAGPPGAAGARGWLAAHGRFYGLWAVILGFLAALPQLGFPIAAGVALALLFRLLGEARWLVCAGLAVAAAAVLHLAFAVGLGVRLPLGVLSHLGK